MKTNICIILVLSIVHLFAAQNASNNNEPLIGLWGSERFFSSAAPIRIVLAQTVQMLSATGNGGQLLVLIPELDLAIGFTGGNYSDYRTWSAWRDKLVPKYIIAAIEN